MIFIKENPMKKRVTDEQIVRILREAESKDTPIRDICKRHVRPSVGVHSKPDYLRGLARAASMLSECHRFLLMAFRTSRL